jgi:RNA polymerase sigma-70 factor, ECF subfamily
MRTPGDNPVTGDRIEARPPGSREPIRLAAFNQYRGLLFSIAYRMLGTVADAEDILQETFIRWQQASDEEIRSPRSFLVTIISRLCINQLQSARAQREQYVGQWLPEPLITEAANDPMGIMRADESISMAFLILLERLTPLERAVFVLREVFEYEYREISSVLGQSEVNCRQILRRARQHVAALRPRFKASAEKQNDLLAKFIRATRGGDLDGLIAVLAHDAVLHTDGGGKAVAMPELIHGGTNVARVIIQGRAKFPPEETRYRIVSINGGPGIVTYSNGRPISAFTFDASDGRIRAIYFVTNPDKLSHIPNLPHP